MIYKPAQNIAYRDPTKKYVFLAGSIENGKAIDWQSEMTEFFISRDIGVFNPRRDDWDPSWVQDYENPLFSQQVRWEINALKQANRILMHFVPETISPISLLEFGMFSNSNKMAVVCPRGYFRKGNVDIVCDVENIPLFDDFEEYKRYIDNLIKNNLI